MANNLMQLEIKSKPKFSKRKCLDCIYHTLTSQGYPTRIKQGNKYHTLNVACNYCELTKQTCLCLDGGKNIVDKRGNDYNNCKLFKSKKEHKLKKKSFKY